MTTKQQATSQYFHDTRTFNTVATGVPIHLTQEPVESSITIVPSAFYVVLHHLIQFELTRRIHLATFIYRQDCCTPAVIDNCLWIYFTRCF
jgi:hypothetical protein